MTYKKKTFFLSLVIALLAVLYIITGAAEGNARRDADRALLNPSLVRLVDRIDLYGPSGVTMLARRNNEWFYLAAEREEGSPVNTTGTAPFAAPSRVDREFPAKDTRVEELLASLTQRRSLAFRGRSGEAAVRLGLAEQQASRVIVRGGVGLPLLDLLVGNADSLAREVYLKRAGKNDIYSSEDFLTIFTDASPSFWLDLRLFPREGPQRNKERTNAFTRSAFVSAQNIHAARIESIELKPPGKERVVFHRRGSAWLREGNTLGEADTANIETWLRGLFVTEAVSFGFSPPEVIEGYVTLHLGDGTERRILFGPEDSRNSRSAIVSPADVRGVFIFPRETVRAIFAPANSP